MAIDVSQIPDERRQELVTLSRVLQAIANGCPPRNMDYLNDCIFFLMLILIWPTTSTVRKYTQT